MSGAMMLPPKMAMHYAELAKAGKADEVIDCKIYIFRPKGQPSQEICLVTLDPPQGHISKRRSK
jgi:hypothetical protein